MNATAPTRPDLRFPLEILDLPSPSERAAAVVADHIDDQAVAAVIVEDLVAQGLIPAARRGKDLAHSNARFFSTWLTHPDARTCPACDEDLATQGIDRLAYVHRVCSCDAAPYDHLVEQLWHLEHLIPATSELHAATLLRSARHALAPRVALTARAAMVETIDRYLAGAPREAEA